VSGYSNPIVGGGGGLVYPSIHSPNFNVASPGASPNPSWAILKNGLAYFFGLVLAGGSITAPDWIINSSGAFFYNGPGALGNPPVLAIVPPGVTQDPFGNGVSPVLNIGNQQGAHAGFDNQGNLFFTNGAGLTTIAIFPALDMMGFYPTGGGAGGLGAAVAALAGTDQFGNKFGGGLTGSILAFDPNASPNKPETWHVPALGAGWTQASGMTVQYTLQLVGLVSLTGRVIASTVAAGTTIFTLPAGYLPNAAISFQCRNVTTNGTVNFTLNNLGQIQIQSGAVATNVVDLTTALPVGMTH